MPTLPASGYPYRPYQSETPSVAPGTPYQDPRTTADTFGAGIGTALREVGQQFERTGDTLANIALQRQQLFNEIAADDQINQAEDRVNRLLYGDPDIPGDTGFKGKRGRGALDGFPTIRRQIEETLKTARSSLTNQQQQKRFDGATRGFRNNVLAEAGRHYDREFHVFAEEEAQGRLKLNFGNVATAASQGDFPAFKASLGKTLLDVEERGVRLGKPREAIEAEKQAATKLASKEWAESLAVKDPLAAQQFVENNKDVLQDLYPDLAARVKTKALSQQALEIVTGTGKPRSTELVRGGAVERFLDLTKQWESGNRNIEQQIVPPGGGYNPSVGRVTGPSTASGYYQITDTTWSDFAPQVGVNIKEFPRAMSAPEPVQRQVARHIALTSGVQHWTDYNKNLRAAVQREGLPVKGVIVAAPVQMANADELIKNLPPRDDGQLPDDQVPGLQQHLQDIAKRIPKDAPPDLWWASVKLARQMMNMQYTDTMNAERLRNMQQKKRDDELTNQFITRMAPDSANFPTSQEILAHPELSADAKRILNGFLTRELMPGPDARTAANNEAELFRRIHLPDDSSDKIRDEKVINEAFGVQRLLTRDGRERLIKDFREANNQATALVEKRKADLLKTVQPKLRPYLSMQNGEMLEAFQDKEGPTRELRYKLYVDEQIAAARKANKNPMDLFDPDKPDYLGKPERVEGFAKGGPDFAAKVTDQQQVQPKSLGELQAAWRAGKYGPYGTAEAKERAAAEAVRLGFVQPAKPKVEVPVR